MATIRININTDLDTSKDLRKQGQIFEKVFGHITILDWGIYSNLNKFWVEVDETDKPKFKPTILDFEVEDGTKMVMDEFNAAREKIFKDTAWARERHSDNVDMSIDDSTNWLEWLEYYQKLRDLPATINMTGTTVDTSTTVTFADTARLVTGMTITGTNIPAGTTISSIDNGTEITISAAATGDGSAEMHCVTSDGSIVFDVYNVEFPTQPA